MTELLLELLSEEIPARMQKRAAEELEKKLVGGLAESGILCPQSASFSTPRRLCFVASGLPDKCPDRVTSRRGPGAEAPKRAVDGFLRSTGLEFEQLEIREEKGRKYFFATIHQPGKSIDEVVAHVVCDTVLKFPWPKSMYWGNATLRWIRPLHSILCILSDDVGHRIVDLEIGGVRAGDQSMGHPFMAAEKFFAKSFEDYESKLRKAFVVLNASERSERIRRDAENLAFAQGLEVVEDPDLVEEVAGLVEWPVVLMGDIDREFLEMPPEVLLTSMRHHQKFFSIRCPADGRIVKFSTVADIDAADGGKTILAGNQKVLKARLSDAMFFWRNDLRTIKKIGLDGMGRRLELVNFHGQLGNMAERVSRIESLARELAEASGCDADTAARAARVVKSDLVSEMVTEFPELQGVMGRRYAQALSLKNGIPEACEQHYSPQGPMDRVPTSPVAVTVGIADRLDQLAGFFGIGEAPTGSRDPFALRRAALGIIRLVIENNIRLPLAPAIRCAIGEYGRQGKLGKVEGNPSADTIVESIIEFVHERLKVFLRDQEIRYDVINACIAARRADELPLLVDRARSLDAFLKSGDGINLLAGFRRANNILEKVDDLDLQAIGEPKSSLFREQEELNLSRALDEAHGGLERAEKLENSADAVLVLASLRRPIDEFFDNVLVNCEDIELRVNRLSLLQHVRATCGVVADLSKIKT
ncbi:MAG: glycine--tRNA ligase subunit beta [Albidovulum sp.]|nr:glycine--tRNA ligase subunit beta [Albidovulum sp.]MDE0533360.1 glycine--tRNA ligase subunit beta [Albidovulum sp.]